MGAVNCVGFWWHSWHFESNTFCTSQGNLDPHALLAPPAVVARMTGDVLSRMAGRLGHIMNLGHGILPDTPIASVEALIARVQETGATTATAATAAAAAAGAHA